MTTNFTNLRGKNISDYGLSLNVYFTTFISTYFIILVLFGTVCNGLLIYVISNNRRLHSTTNAFIINLLASDLLVAVSVLPFEIEYIIRGVYEHGKFFCGLRETIFFFSLPSSMVNLCLLTFERFFKIWKPYKYEILFARRRVIVIIILSWSYTLTIALLPIMLDPNSVHVQAGQCYTCLPFFYWIYQIVGNFLVPLICVVTVNLFMFGIAQRHFSEIELQKVHLDDEKSKRKRKLHVSGNFKAAKTILMLVGVFLFCWLTYIILVISNIACQECHPRELTWMGNAINYSSIALNPLLYGLRNSDVRKVLQRQCRRWYCLRKDTISKRGIKGDHGIVTLDMLLD